MNSLLLPGGIARRLLLRRALGGGLVLAVVGRAAAAAEADAEIVVDNFIAELPEPTILVTRPCTGSDDSG